MKRQELPCHSRIELPGILWGAYRPLPPGQGQVAHELTKPGADPATGPVIGSAPRPASGVQRRRA